MQVTFSGETDGGPGLILEADNVKLVTVYNPDEVRLLLDDVHVGSFDTDVDFVLAREHWPKLPAREVNREWMLYKKVEITP